MGCCVQSRQQIGFSQKGSSPIDNKSKSKVTKQEQNKKSLCESKSSEDRKRQSNDPRFSSISNSNFNQKDVNSQIKTSNLFNSSNPLNPESVDLERLSNKLTVNAEVKDEKLILVLNNNVAKDKDKDKEIDPNKASNNNTNREFRHHRQTNSSVFKVGIKNLPSNQSLLNRIAMLSNIGKPIKFQSQISKISYISDSVKSSCNSAVTLQPGTAYFKLRNNIKSQLNQGSAMDSTNINKDKVRHSQVFKSNYFNKDFIIEAINKKNKMNQIKVSKNKEGSSDSKFKSKSSSSSQSSLSSISSNKDKDKDKDKDNNKEKDISNFTPIKIRVMKKPDKAEAIQNTTSVNYLNSKGKHFFKMRNSALYLISSILWHETLDYLDQTSLRFVGKTCSFLNVISKNPNLYKKFFFADFKKDIGESAIDLDYTYLSKTSQASNVSKGNAHCSVLQEFKQRSIETKQERLDKLGKMFSPEKKQILRLKQSPLYASSRSVAKKVNSSSNPLTKIRVLKHEFGLKSKFNEADTKDKPYILHTVDRRTQTSRTRISVPNSRTDEDIRRILEEKILFHSNELTKLRNDLHSQSQDSRNKPTNNIPQLKINTINNNLLVSRDTDKECLDIFGNMTDKLSTGGNRSRFSGSINDFEIGNHLKSSGRGSILNSLSQETSTKNIIPRLKFSGGDSNSQGLHKNALSVDNKSTHSNHYRQIISSSKYQQNMSYIDPPLINKNPVTSSGLSIVSTLEKKYRENNSFNNNNVVYSEEKEFYTSKNFKQVRKSITRTASFDVSNEVSFINLQINNLHIHQSIN